MGNLLQASLDAGEDPEVWLRWCEERGVIPVSLERVKQGYRVQVDCRDDDLWDSLPGSVELHQDVGTVLQAGDDWEAAVEVVPGNFFPVTQDCIDGTCECIYELAGVKSQLKPCRFAAGVMFSSNGLSLRNMYVLTGVCRGFKIVDAGCNTSYCCSNYSSITTGVAAEKMDEKVPVSYTHLTLPTICSV